MTANVVFPSVGSAEGGMTMSRRRSVDTLNLDEVRTRFENWRQNPRGKQRIPDELWSDAIELARRDGVNPTAAALHLDGAKLKRRIVAADSMQVKEVGSAQACRKDYD
jgi:hypothetical protein